MSGKGLKRKIKPSRKINPKKKSPKGTKINILNDSCLSQIFKYLSFKDKLNLEFVNRRFNAVSKLSWDHVTSLALDSSFKEQYYLQENFFYVEERDLDFLNTAFVISVLRRCGNHLTHLYIDGEYVNDLDWEKIFENCTKYFKNITELKIKEMDIENEILKQLFENNKNLKSISLENFRRISELNTSSLTSLNPHLIEELSFNCYKFDDSNKFLLKFLSELSNIKILKLVNVDYDLNLAIDALNNGKIEKLIQLSLAVFPSLDTEKLKNLITRQKQLSKIHLKEMPENLIETILSLDHLDEIRLHKLDPEFLNALPRFINLKSLDIIVHNFTDEFLESLSKCMNLQKLTMTISNFNLTSESANHFSNFKHLESLKLTVSDYEEIEHGNSLLPISKCENLKKLSINGLCFEEDSNTTLAYFEKLEDFEIIKSNITNEILEELLSGCYKLKNCNIRECKYIDNEFIDPVYESRSLLCCCSDSDDDESKDDDSEDDEYEDVDSDDDESNLKCNCKPLNITYSKTNISKYSIEKPIDRFINLQEAGAFDKWKFYSLLQSLF